MPDMMNQLRRSPRKLLERDGHPGPGPGQLALVMARAGVGKTAFLVAVGLDALLSGQRVLHLSLDGTVEKVRDWYDDVLMEMLRDDKKLDLYSPIQLRIERRRHIHTYVGDSFSPDRLRDSLKLLGEVMDFVPQVIVLDHVELEGIDPVNVEEIKAQAAEIGAELWLACQTHRDAPAPAAGYHLPPPADQLEELADLAFRLDSHDAKVRLHVLKDRQQMLDKDLHILLDPQTLLVSVGLGA
jgi:hypothetical protein